MKNINLAPPFLRHVKGVWVNKNFIFVSLFLLILLSCVYFSSFIPMGRQWKDKFVAKIGSIYGPEMPKKTKKLPINKKSPEGEKNFNGKAEEQGLVENIHEMGMKKGEQVLEETNKEPVEIEIKENTALKKADNEIVAGVIEEEPVSEKADIKAVLVEIEKEPILAKAEITQEWEEAEKIKQTESSAKTISNYSIQVCSCVIKENADKAFRRLDDQGYAPIMKEIVGHVKMHNIYTSDFTKKAEAVKLLNRLQSDGFDSVILPSSRGKYKVRITSCFYMESAQKVIKRLNRLGYKTSIRKEFIPTKMYSVLLSNFENLQEAEATSQELTRKGYPTPILKHNPQT